jgi:hypothetical protein
LYAADEKSKEEATTITVVVTTNSIKA